MDELDELDELIEEFGLTQEQVNKAKLSYKSRRNLPDSSFAYVDGKGKRHLPIHDAEHVRDALSRFDQTHFDSTADRTRARRKVMAAARRFGVKVSDKDPVQKAMLAEGDAPLSLVMPIIKADEIEGVIYGVACVADVRDRQGQIIPERELIRAAHDFLYVDEQHYYDTHGETSNPDKPLVMGSVEIPGKLVESHVSEGQWHVAFRPDSIEVAKAAHDGKFVGFSIDGWSNVQKATDGSGVLRNLSIDGLSLVRKGYVPVVPGSDIKIVKAQEEGDVGLMSGIATALKNAFGGKVNKAQMAAHVVSDQGEHGRMNGMHSHDHTHCDDKGNMYTHSHEHVHDDDSTHYHDYRPGHPDPEADANDGSGAAGDVKPAKKADEDMSEQHTHETPVTTPEQVPAWLGTLTQALDAKFEEVKKAIPTEDALARLIDEKVAAAVAPVSKAVEEVSLSAARVPKTPAPDGSIDPEEVRKAQAAAASPRDRQVAIKGMSLLDAIKYLNKNS